MPRFINTITFVASATVSSSRSDDDAMPVRIGEEERQRNRCRPAATLRADGGCGRSLRRSSSPIPLGGINSSSLLDLASQAPSANVTVFMNRGTRSQGPLSLVKTTSVFASKPSCFSVSKMRTALSISSTASRYIPRRDLSVNLSEANSGKQLRSRRSTRRRGIERGQPNSLARHPVQIGSDNGGMSKATEVSVSKVIGKKQAG